MTELSPEARAAIERMRSSYALGAEQRVRVRDAVQAAIAMPPGGHSPAAPAGALAASSKLAVTAKVVGTIAIVSATSFGVFHASKARAPSAPQPMAPAALEPFHAPDPLPPSTPAAEEPASSTAPIIEAPRLGAAARSSRSSSSHSPEPEASAPRPPSTLADEMALLARAEAALRGGRAREAMTLLDEHAAEYPRGVLSEERSAERVLALCALGRIAEARDAGARFLRAAPNSPYAPRVRASCAKLDAKDQP